MRRFPFFFLLAFIYAIYIGWEFMIEVVVTDETQQYHRSSNDKNGNPQPYQHNDKESAPNHHQSTQRHLPTKKKGFVNPFDAYDDREGTKMINLGKKKGFVNPYNAYDDEDTRTNLPSEIPLRFFNATRDTPPSGFPPTLPFRLNATGLNVRYPTIADVSGMGSGRVPGHPTATWQSLAARVIYIRNAVPLEMCDAFVAEALNVFATKPERIQTHGGWQQVVNNPKHPTKCAADGPWCEALQNVTTAVVGMGWVSGPTIRRYVVGRGLPPHTDPSRSHITLIAWFSDHEGGETSFPILGLLIPAKKGDGVLIYHRREDFAYDPAVLHGSTVVTSGTKWAGYMHPMIHPTVVCASPPHSTTVFGLCAPFVSPYHLAKPFSDTPRPELAALLGDIDGVVGLDPKCRDTVKRVLCSVHFPRCRPNTTTLVRACVKSCDGVRTVCGEEGFKALRGLRGMGLLLDCKKGSLPDTNVPAYEGGTTDHRCVMA